MNEIPVLSQTTQLNAAELKILNNCIQNECDTRIRNLHEIIIQLPAANLWPEIRGKSLKWGALETLLWTPLYIILPPIKATAVLVSVYIFSSLTIASVFGCKRKKNCTTILHLIKETNIAQTLIRRQVTQIAQDTSYNKQTSPNKYLSSTDIKREKRIYEHIRNSVSETTQVYLQTHMYCQNLIKQYSQNPVVLRRSVSIFLMDQVEKYKESELVQSRNSTAPTESNALLVRSTDV